MSGWITPDQILLKKASHYPLGAEALRCQLHPCQWAWLTILVSVHQAWCQMLTSPLKCFLTRVA